MWAPGKVRGPSGVSGLDRVSGPDRMRGPDRVSGPDREPEGNKLLKGPKGPETVGVELERR